MWATFINPGIEGTQAGQRPLHQADGCWFTDLADMTGSVFMSDGEPAGGKYSLTGYKLTTTDIESVNEITT